jgi:hypothetical protein
LADLPLIVEPMSFRRTPTPSAVSATDAELDLSAAAVSETDAELNLSAAAVSETDAALAITGGEVSARRKRV